MDDSIEQFRIRMHAKVNLALAVGCGDLLSGLHPICSWMHAIDLSDLIEIYKLPDGQESSFAIGWAQASGDDLPVDWSAEDDLVVRAHKAVEAYIHRTLGVKIRVSKSIPAGGGLGGGSADAAGVLIGINTLFDLGLRHDELVEVAMSLGSDIPFFLDTDSEIPRAAIVTGFGDQVARLEQSASGESLMLIFPSFGCHTGRVYQAFDELVDSGHVLESGLVEEIAGHREIDADRLFNDLAEGAKMVSPELAGLIEEFSGLFEQRVHVSGSGSTLFVLGPNDALCPEDGLMGCRFVKTKLC